MLKKNVQVANFTYEVQNGDLYSKQFFELFNIFIYNLLWI